LLGARLKEDTYDLVDSELVAVLLNLPQPEFSEDTLIEARKRPWLEPLPAPFPTPGSRFIPGVPGFPDIRLIIADPNPGASGRPVYIHMHGGGYVTTAL
jgi:acetyl esterase/lipase